METLTRGRKRTIPGTKMPSEPTETPNQAAQTDHLRRQRAYRNYSASNQAMQTGPCKRAISGRNTPAELTEIPTPGKPMNHPQEKVPCFYSVIVGQLGSVHCLDRYQQQCWFYGWNSSRSVHRWPGPPPCTM